MLDCASCHVYVMVVYHVVCFFLVALLLDSSGNVMFVRIRSTTLVRLLHGLVLLPCGILGKVTITLDITSIFAFYLFALSLCRATYHLFIKPPILPCQASNPPSQQTVVWLSYRFCSSPLIALLVAGEVEDCSMLEHDYVGISQYLLFN